MKGDKTRIYADADDFYALGGNFIMILEPQAAVDVCKSAFDHGQVVSRIEGGVWSDMKFQPRGDCIWDGAYPPIQDEVARANNVEASRFIKEASKEHNAFVLTTAPLSANKGDGGN